MSTPKKVLAKGTIIKLGVAGGGVLAHQSEEPLDGQERALEVVGDGVGEALELGVLGLEVLDQSLALAEQAPALLGQAALAARRNDLAEHRPVVVITQQLLERLGSSVQVPIALAQRGFE